MISGRRGALLSLIFISILHGVNHTYGIFLSPLNEEMRRFFEVETISTITSFKTTYLMIYAASNLVFGLLTNRISSRWTLGIGGLLNAAVVAAYAFIGPLGIPYMHVLWAASGAAAGTYHPVANALITRLYAGRKGWALGITGLGASTGFAFGPLLTGVLSKSCGFNWMQVALVFGAVGAACSAAVLFTVSDVPHEDPPKTATPSDAPAARNGTGALAVFLTIVVIAVGMREMAIWGVMDITDFFVSRAHRTSAAGYLFLLFLPGIAVQPLAGAMSDRAPRHLVAAGALLLHGASTALMPLASLRLLFLPFLLLGIGQAASVPTVEAYMADYTTPRNRGIVFGVVVTAGLGIGSLGPLLSGMLVDHLGGTVHAYNVCLYGLGSLTGAAAVIMLFSNAAGRLLGLKQE